MLKHTFTVVEAQASLTQPFTGPRWPENTFTRGGEFFWGGEQVAAMAHQRWTDVCAVAFLLHFAPPRVVLFIVEQGHEYPAVDRLAAAYNILRLHPNAYVPSEITGCL